MLKQFRCADLNELKAIGAAESGWHLVVEEAGDGPEQGMDSSAAEFGMSECMEAANSKKEREG